MKGGSKYTGVRQRNEGRRRIEAGKKCSKRKRQRQREAVRGKGRVRQREASSTSYMSESLTS